MSLFSVKSSVAVLTLLIINLCSAKFLGLKDFGQLQGNIARDSETPACVFCNSLVEHFDKYEKMPPRVDTPEKLLQSILDICRLPFDDADKKMCEQMRGKEYLWAIKYFEHRKDHKTFSSAVSPNAFKIVFAENRKPLTEFRKTNETSGEKLELKKGLPTNYQDENSNDLIRYLNRCYYYTLERSSI